MNNGEMSEWTCELNGLPFNGQWSPAALERRKHIQLGHARIRAHDAHADEIERKVRAGLVVNREPGPVPPRASRPTPLVPLLARDRLFDWYSSVHEACHAVAALVHGCQVKRVVVSRVRCYTTHSIPQTQYARAVITFAGPMGEGFMTDSNEFPDAARGDYGRLSELGLSPDERSAARADAVKLLATHQKKVERFADWMAVWGLMDGTEAEKLFRK